MKSLVVLLMVCGLASVSWAGWTVVNNGDPAIMPNNGYLVKASNLGQGAGVQTINGITYDIDFSNISGGANPTSSSWANKFYSGSDPAISNLLNNGGLVSEWNPKNMVFSFTNLTVGHDYRFQLLIGGDWGGCDANLYGANNEYQYVYFGNSVPKLATFTWTAGSSTASIKTNAGVGHANHFNLAYALHNTSIPEPATMMLLGAGALSMLIKRKK